MRVTPHNGVKDTPNPKLSLCGVAFEIFLIGMEKIDFLALSSLCFVKELEKALDSNNIPIEMFEKMIYTIGEKLGFNV